MLVGCASRRVTTDGMGSLKPPSQNVFLRELESRMQNRLQELSQDVGTKELVIHLSGI
jgi:hypothetical protein